MLLHIAIAANGIQQHETSGVGRQTDIHRRPSRLLSALFCVMAIKWICLFLFIYWVIWWYRTSTWLYTYSTRYGLSLSIRCTFVMLAPFPQPCYAILIRLENESERPCLSAPGTCALFHSWSCWAWMPTGIIYHNFLKPNVAAALVCSFLVGFCCCSCCYSPCFQQTGSERALLLSFHDSTKCL